MSGHTHHHAQHPDPGALTTCSVSAGDAHQVLQAARGYDFGLVAAMQFSEQIRADAYASAYYQSASKIALTPNA